MRIRDFFPDFKDEGEVIASWGEAKLVKYLDGKLELKGGSKEDQAEAREWMSLFWHEAVLVAALQHKSVLPFPCEFLSLAPIRLTYNTHPIDAVIAQHGGWPWK